MNNHIVETLKIDEQNIGFAVKANILVKNQITNCCSKVLSNFKPSISATVLNQLKQFNYEPKYITTMDEFGMGSIGYSELYGLTTNSIFKDCISGGSSAGSAVSVALNQVEFALGSSTGGSIRLPASLNQIIGFEPSYGAVSRFGLISFAHSLDKIGILAKNINTIQNIFDIIRQKDNGDMSQIETNLHTHDYKTIAGINILEENIDKEIFEDIKEIYKLLNIKYFEDNLPFEEMDRLYKYIAYSEAFSNLQRYTGLLFAQDSGSFEEQLKNVKNKFGLEVKRRIDLGEKYLKTGEYEQKMFIRSELTNKFNNFFKTFPFLILPTTNRYKIFNYELGEKIFLKNIDQYLTFTNLIHGCAITFPGPINKSGIQIVSYKGNDLALLELANKIIKLCLK